MADTHVLDIPVPINGMRRDVPREGVPAGYCWNARNLIHTKNRVRKVYGYSKIGSTMLGAVQLIRDVALLSGDITDVALTTSDAYEYSGGDWVRRTPGSPGAPVQYTGGKRWITAQVSQSDVLLATNNKEAPQKWIGPGNNFAALGGSPPFTKAAGVMNFRDFYVWWGTTESGTTYQTRVRWSDFSLYETYTIGAASLAGFEDLSGSDFIRWIEPISDDSAIVYRERSLWRMRFVGAPLVFFFEELANGIGMDAPYGLETYGTYHEFIGSDDIYYFDGNDLTQVSDVARILLLGELDQATRDTCLFLIEEQSHHQYMFFPAANNNGFPNKGLIEDYEHAHGSERGLEHGWWFRDDIAPTGIGYWSEAVGQTWDNQNGNWTLQSGAWNDASILPDRPTAAWGDNTGKAYRFGPELSDGDGVAIDTELESGLYDLANLAIAENPRNPMKFKRNGKSVLLTCRVEFESRGGQVWYVDLGFTDGVKQTVTYTTFTIPANAASPYFIGTWVVGRYFAYRHRTTGLGASPLFGDLSMEFVPDSEVV